jgi:GNAT superfamily N-acetyltransferase
VDEDTPELSLAVDFSHRNSGIGSVLMFEFFLKLIDLGYKQVALSVDYRNYARQIYLNRGFKDLKIEGNSVLMLAKF